MCIQHILGFLVFNYFVTVCAWHTEQKGYLTWLLDLAVTKVSSRQTTDTEKNVKNRQMSETDINYI